MFEKSGRTLGALYQKKFSELGGIALLQTIEIQSNHEGLSSMAKALTETYFEDESDDEILKVSREYENNQVSIDKEMDIGQNIESFKI